MDNHDLFFKREETSTSCCQIYDLQDASAVRRYRALTTSTAAGLATILFRSSKPRVTVYGGSLQAQEYLRYLKLAVCSSYIWTGTNGKSAFLQDPYAHFEMPRVD